MKDSPDSKEQELIEELRKARENHNAEEAERILKSLPEIYDDGDVIAIVIPKKAGKDKEANTPAPPDPA